MHGFAKNTLRFLKRALFKGKKSSLYQPEERSLPLKDVKDDEILRYPPFAKGLPAASTERLLQSQAELIERIRMALGINMSEFNKLLLPVLRNYAAFVHLLPASEAHHHRGAGGLLRHGLEAAFNAAQASDGVVFSITGTPKEKRTNEPRWRLVSTLAGLLHDVGKPFSDMIVTDGDGKAWDPNSEALAEWLERNNVERYFLRWRDNRHKRHEAFALFAVERMLPVETRQYISISNTMPEITGALLEAFSGVRLDGPVTKLMIFADQQSVQRDLKQNKLNVDEFAYGVPVERYVFDALRRLISSGKWKVNEPGAKVWHLNQGVFIAWRSLGDMHDLISRDKIPGIPKDPDTLADILIERGFAIQNKVTEDGEEATYRYWEVQPEGIPAKILMLRFQSHELIFTSEPPPPVRGVVTGDEDGLSVSATPAEAAQHEDAHAPKNAQGETESDQKESDEDILKATEAISNEVDDLFGDVGLSGILNILQTSSDTDEAKPEPAEVTEVGQSQDQDLLPATQVKQEEKPKKEATKDHAATTPTNNKVSHVQLLQAATESSSTNNSSEVKAVKTPPKTANPEAKAPGVKAKIKAEKPEVEVEVEIVASSKDSLCAVLAKHPSASSLLEQILLPSVDDPAKLGERIRIIRGQTVIPFPSGVKDLGERSEVIKTLDDAGVLEVDLVMPGRKVQEIGGVKCLVLKSTIGDSFKEAIGYEGSANVSEKGNSKESRARPYADLITKKVKSSLKTLNAATKSKKKAGATEEHPVTQNKTVSKPLKRPIQAVSEEQRKPARRIIENIEEVDVAEVTVMQLQDEDSFVSDKNQITNVVQRFKQMVIDGEGRWLTSPVSTCSEGSLSTSSLSIDQLVLEYPAFSKASVRREIIAAGFSFSGQKIILRKKNIPKSTKE